MQYMGSKNRLSKYLIPIIQSYIDTNNIETYIEPLVGGANVIDKIKCKNKIGYDIHSELIELLKQAQKDCSLFPNSISEKEYIDVKNNKEKYDKWYVGLVGFTGSYGSKYFGGYAKNTGEYLRSGRDRTNEAIRNIKKQSQNLKNIEFIQSSFQNIDIEKLNGCVIYCDPPYKGTTKYKTEIFPYEEYYDWVRELSKNNIVICSEYNMPDDFECIWEKEHKTLIDSNKSIGDSGNIRIEKLFIHKSRIYDYIK